ncbi:MAG: hypothetical protein KAJ91_01025 [Candidatus Aenigmarchaeota archaeon]|nr:hypothetical protein [Candidatus Aenigmarchaeota archaeon]MCK5333503.1 hypothetical protein [Candidatus Aenigmarchaeota archaeon]
MLSEDAKVSLIFASVGIVAGLAGSKLSLLPAGIIGVLLLSALKKFAIGKFPEAEITQAGVLPYITTWIAVLFILANI